MIYSQVVACKGLEVNTRMVSSSMELAVEPGSLIYSDGSVAELLERTNLLLRPAGTKAFNRQSYTIHGKGTRSPCGWNGEGIRGSGGAPYQRMVSGTLKVWNEDRTILFRPEQDYVHDEYWGTIKKHPDGAIPEGAKLSLDYEVWLCRYDAVVADVAGADNRMELCIVEGDVEAMESRELLLPNPPTVRSGYVLAHVFLGWGQTRIYNEDSYVLHPTGDYGKPGLTVPVLNGTYMDMVARTYVVEILAPLKDGQLLLRMGATGEDYGTGRMLDTSTLRWTEPMIYEKKSKIPLVLVSAYGSLVDWGLEIDLSCTDTSQLPENRIIKVVALPQMIFDLRNQTSEIEDSIPIERIETLIPIVNKLKSGTPVRIAFYGESTTRNGRWPYQLMEGLRQLFPLAIIKSSNIAVSGENSLVGIRRLQDEVLNLQPDLVLVEYMINDTCTGKPVEVEKNQRRIIEMIQSIGAVCMLITGNGMNPLFSIHGSSRQFHATYETYRQLAAEYKCAFVGGFQLFSRLHQFGIYFLTELKGNMINHPYGNVDPHWGSFDRELSRSILNGFTSYGATSTKTTTRRPQQ
jgi:hypothetical protein